MKFSALVALATALIAAPLAQAQFGYATLGSGTTGGTGGTTTTVTSLAALRTALTGTAKKIIRINTVITGDGEVIDVGSNTSILGGCGGGITGGGFRVKNGSNVIIRNLKITKSPAPTDAILVQASKNVWIDHNEISSEKGSDKDFYDGAIDVTHGSDYVTVSWNYVHDHWKTSLVGHSDSNSSEDSGHLTVTYAFNYWKNVGSRLPSLRFGTGHIYNNYATTVSESGINSRVGAQVLVQNNVFEAVTKPLLTLTEGGYAVQSGNDWGGATPELNPGTFTSPPYSYSLTATASTKTTGQLAEPRNSSISLVPSLLTTTRFYDLSLPSCQRCWCLQSHRLRSTNRRLGIMLYLRFLKYNECAAFSCFPPTGTPRVGFLN